MRVAGETALEQRLADTCARVLEAAGFELVQLRFYAGRHAALRIVIDRLGPEQGVTLDDCAYVSRLLGAVLDEEDPIEGAYELEVSSPGARRPLTRPRHFVRAVGERVRMRVRVKPEEGESNEVVETVSPAVHTLRGVIEAADETGTVIRDETGRSRRFSYEDVQDARLEFDADRWLGRARRT